jgi:hypothetical protein
MIAINQPLLNHFRVLQVFFTALAREGDSDDEAASSFVDGEVGLVDLGLQVLEVPLRELGLDFDHLVLYSRPPNCVDVAPVSCKLQNSRNYFTAR